MVHFDTMNSFFFFLKLLKLIFLIFEDKIHAILNIIFSCNLFFVDSIFRKSTGFKETSKNRKYITKILICVNVINSVKRHIILRFL